MANNISIPTSYEPIDDKGNSITQVWWRFFNALLNRTQDTVQASVATGLTATGNSQGTAFKITTDWVAFSAVAAATGAILPNFGEGVDILVINGGANNLNLYPPVGCQIAALGTNNPLAMVPGAIVIFYQLTSTQFTYK